MNPEQRHPLFAYGTLRFPQVLTGLLGRHPAATPVSAPGWRAAELPGRVYPGLVPDADATTSGILLTDLTADEWRVLDAFEDAEYVLRTVPVTPGDRLASAYVWTAEYSETTWRAEEFAATRLAAFLRRQVESD
ncbi:gamma-glutamylcyclotransferase [Nocardia panacis]|uniref:Putative gamma-glutamylcyclotransferase n=1 Tax=Nocardia panacis TaxID=2340916 RepID=A0A3A4K565_9NOCA|nr:gamma-glutamylcyclotransferase family protein [Nocardia panacis]RJO69459.1 gamma-glutamylcyclotransferase [Nocardia panacis]